MANLVRRQHSNVSAASMSRDVDKTKAEDGYGIEWWLLGEKRSVPFNIMLLYIK